MADLLKNAYDQRYIERLANAVYAVFPVFEREEFATRVFADNWQDLELKARMYRIRESLYQCVPLPYAEAVAVLIQAAPDFGGFEGMFFPDFVAVYGLDDWEVSIDALEVLTAYSSSEFAVRPFIEKYPEAMMEQMYRWSQSDNYHVRRLASEGCRPRLPWANALPKFKKNPDVIFPILTQLRADSEDYVRRSVANNLNDISKDHPVRVMEWVKAHAGECAETDWIIKHACRSLLKQAYPPVMSFYGYTQTDHIQVSALQLQTDKVTIGDELFFRLELIEQSGGAIGRVRIEYVVEYLKANGKHQSKVFKISEGDVASSQLSLERKQSFRQMSTRVHYAGEHFLAIRVNGEVLARVAFQLIEA